MAECRLPRGVVFWANAVDHDCRNEARRYCRRAENGVALATKHPRVHRNSPDRSSDLTRQPLRTPIANLCLSPAPTDAPKHSAFSVPNRHQTNHHPARPSIGAANTTPHAHIRAAQVKRCSPTHLARIAFRFAESNFVTTILSLASFLRLSHGASAREHRPLLDSGCNCPRAMNCYAGRSRQRRNGCSSIAVPMTLPNGAN